ncbi:cyclic GMP-AMP synthase DncV-like nucleotidyltransferase [Sulfitobacter sp. 1A12057]|uniref:SMODS domain-containing nucleotidyltransferase n=1 Tax=Sulfitobacter sp. 1A12057 TaxID=3368567 RepID=UPI003745E745
MKLVSEFNKFMDNTVNLNETRLSMLEARAATIKNFVRSSDWEPTILGFIEQGSWANKTIIRPVDGGEFDADLLVKVKPVDGWDAAEYVKELGRVFRSSGRYSSKTQVYDFCVTITYADECKIDIAPLISGRLAEGAMEVCDKRSNIFLPSNPIEYTKWLRQKNSYSGNNSFRKATRLIKYIRDIKKRFSCQSVLLTTLIADRINWWDKDSGSFADTPTALQTIMARMDDWLQCHEKKPEVLNPHLKSEDFADLWNDTQYANFRNFIHKYRGWIDDAMAAETRSDSIARWRKIFGDEFAPGEVAVLSEARAVELATSFMSRTADHASSLVTMVLDYGVTVLPRWFHDIPHKQSPPWPVAEDRHLSVSVYAKYSRKRTGSREVPISDGETVSPDGGLWFDVKVDGFRDIPTDCYVRWRITNTGTVALTKNAGRGTFYPPSTGVRRWEELQYKGVHIAEAFVIRTYDNSIIGISAPFHVVID